MKNLILSLALTMSFSAFSLDFNPLSKSVNINGESVITVKTITKQDCEKQAFGIILKLSNTADVIMSESAQLTKASECKLANGDYFYNNIKYIRI